eukprot:COSAG06_NODE_9570_length_1867_cov_265.307692_1_plen_556_part_01
MLVARPRQTAGRHAFGLLFLLAAALPEAHAQGDGHGGADDCAALVSGLSSELDAACCSTADCSAGPLPQCSLRCAALWNPVVSRCSQWLEANVPQFDSLTEQCLAALPIEAGGGNSCDKGFLTAHADSLPSLCGESGCSAECGATVKPLVARCLDSMASHPAVSQHLQPFADRCAVDGRAPILRVTLVLRGRGSSNPDSIAAFLQSLAAALRIDPVSVWVSEIIGRPDHASVTVMIVADADAGGAQSLETALRGQLADPSSPLLRAGTIDGSKPMRSAIMYSTAAAPELCEEQSPCAANAACTSTRGAYLCSCLTGFEGDGYSSCSPVQLDAIFMEEALNQNDAEAACNRVRRSLVSVHSEGQNSIVQHLAGESEVWIGLTQSNGGRSSWTDGSPIDWELWGADRDASSCLADGSCGCALAYTHAESGRFSWEHLDCTERRRFVCGPATGDVAGCTDRSASNFNALATASDGSCVYGNACGDGRFSTEYFASSDLTGQAALTQCEDSASHDWSSDGSHPLDAVGGSGPFSARWHGSFDFAAGEYRFTTVSDDGSRL